MSAPHILCGYTSWVLAAADVKHYCILLQCAAVLFIQPSPTQLQVVINKKNLLLVSDPSIGGELGLHLRVVVTQAQGGRRSELPPNTTKATLYPTVRARFASPSHH